MAPQRQRMKSNSVPNVPRLAKTSSADIDSVLMNHRPPRHPLIEEPYCCCSCSKLRPGIQWLGE